MRPKKIVHQIVFGLLVVTCLSLWVLPKLYYAVIDSGKNHYTLSVPELDSEKTGMAGIMLTVAVDQPKKETIVITSNGSDKRNWLGGDNIEQFFSSDHPELSEQVELLENGIKLKLKASNRKVTLKIPVAITESTTANFDVRRGNRSIVKEKMTFIQMDGPVMKEGQVSSESKIPVRPTSNSDRPDKLGGPTFGKTSPVFARGPFSRGRAPEITTMAYPSGSGALTETASVANYRELLAAVANTSISRIEFKNDIIADTGQPNVLSRDLVIDGKGFLFSVTSLKNKDVFRLENIRSANKVQFMLANMRVDYSDADRGKTLIGVTNGASEVWKVTLEDIQSEGSSTSHGRLVYNNSGLTILTGNINWQSATSKEVSNDDPKRGLINSANIKIVKTDDGREPSINMTANRTLLRTYKVKENESTSLVVEAGIVNLHSVNAQAIFMNSENSRAAVIFHVKGQNTRLNATASGEKGLVVGTVYIVGSNTTGKSYTRIENGAQVSIHSKGNPSSGKSGAAFINQVSRGGVFYLTGKGTKMTCVADTPSNGLTATFRFRLVGEQTFYMSDRAELKIVRNYGKTAGLRFYGKDNAFYISGGAKVLIDNLGQGDNQPSDGGDTNGRQGIQYPSGSGGTSVFDLRGKGSDIAVNSRYGPALEGSSGAFKFFVGNQASISFIGRTASSRAGGLMLPNNSLSITLDTPYFYEFRNNRGSGGPWLSGGNSRSVFTAKNTELEVWKKGVNVNLDGPSINNWTRMDYKLEGAGLSKISSTSNPSFNSTTYGKASDYAKISGGSLEAEIDSIRQPTNADKRIFGRAVVPATYSGIDGTGEKRAAYTDEVWVTLKLYRLKFKPGITSVQRDPMTSIVDFSKSYDVVTYEKEVPTIGYKNTTAGADGRRDGVKQFDEPKTYGIFEWDLSKDSQIKEDSFLWAGEYVEVISVRRGNKTPSKDYDIVSSQEKFVNKGRYVFNVRPVEVTTDSLTEGHIDPILDLASSKSSISDATKAILLQATAKGIKKHAALVPLPEGRTPVNTGSASDARTGKVAFYPMLAIGEDNRTNSLLVDRIAVDDKKVQASQLNLYTYLNPEDLSADVVPELFAFSAWGDDISSLGKDLPPTFQTVKNVTTGDAANLVVAFENTASGTGLRMPSRESKYHDTIFKKAPSLKLESYSPTELAITLDKKGGDVGAVNLSKEQVVVYQMKLSNPRLARFPNQLFTSYSATFEITGNAKIFDAYGGITTPSGVSETHTDKYITFTSNSQAALGVELNISVIVGGNFTIKAVASGRTAQEKTLAMPRGSWDKSGETHNFVNDGFTPGLQVPNPEDPTYPDYYRLLAAPDKVVSVTTSRSPVGASSKVYLSITDNQLTVYYRQLKQSSDMKVTVDGKALTSFKVDNSDVEQSKPLNLKIKGSRNIVAVTYTLADGTIETVTWKNPKISN
ncbi:pectate lyase-like adhesive domain-containing protein [Lactococcus carnosus]|uniref:pectate lyase-like adhesive domain-containing protein n=1 Tax=Pseudolactococcus carnosus TaxID=2749961 RepID=UPI001FBAF375|nr:pectate lyase-like adhesive domain-containing protein [Lactococcus carnosus]MCJ2002628.1 hypothetical protein [Lactococcus carnosus]